MQLAAVAPKYGWTDLAHALVPNGRYLPGPDRPADPDARAVAQPARRAEAQPAARRSRPRATFAAGDRGRVRVPDLADAVCGEPGLQRGLPACSTRSSASAPPTSSCASSAGSPSTRGDADPRVQRRAASPTSCSRSRSSGGWRTTLRSFVPDYPIKEYYGDFGDLDAEQGRRSGRTCATATTTRARSTTTSAASTTRPRRFMRFGVATRLNRFLDHYARPPGNPRQPRPDSDVTVVAPDLPAERERRVAARRAGRALQRGPRSGTSRRTGGCSS